MYLIISVLAKNPSKKKIHIPTLSRLVNFDLVFCLIDFVLECVINSMQCIFVHYMYFIVLLFCGTVKNGILMK